MGAPRARDPGRGAQRVLSASRGRAVPRGVKHKMSNYPLRPRRRMRIRQWDYTVRILK